MGFFRRFKKKDFSETELEVPSAPTTKGELPSPKDVATIKAVKDAVETTTIPQSMKQMEETAVKQQKDELEEREDLRLTKPLFIPADAYKELLADLGLTRGILQDNEDIVDKVADFKEDQDREFNRWETQLKDMQRKLIFIDKTLFGIK